MNNGEIQRVTASTRQINRVARSEIVRKIESHTSSWVAGFLLRVDRCVFGSEFYWTEPHSHPPKLLLFNNFLAEIIAIGDNKFGPSCFVVW